MKHEFKRGDGVNTGSPEETRRLLHLANMNGYPVFFASLNTSHSTSFSWSGVEFIGEAFRLRGAISVMEFEYLVTKHNQKEVKPSKPTNMRHEFNAGDGVHTSCGAETRKLLQLAKDKGYPVFADSITSTVHTALCFLNGRFCGANEATVTKRMAKTAFIKIMNETVVETPKPRIPMVNKSEVIIIPAQLQREMFAAATQSQMPFLDQHINLKTGAITKGGMMEIYNVACASWREKLANEWNWLKIQPLTIVFQRTTDGHMLFGNGMSQALIQPRIFEDEYQNRAFYLNENYTWKIEVAKNGQQVLVPERR